jgi:hypothetical protein
MGTNEEGEFSSTKPIFYYIYAFAIFHLFFFIFKKKFQNTIYNRLRLFILMDFDFGYSSFQFPTSFAYSLGL